MLPNLATCPETTRMYSVLLAHCALAPARLCLSSLHPDFRTLDGKAIFKNLTSLQSALCLLPVQAPNTPSPGVTPVLHLLSSQDISNPD